MKIIVESVDDAVVVEADVGLAYVDVAERHGWVRSVVGSRYMAARASASCMAICYPTMNIGMSILLLSRAVDE